MKQSSIAYLGTLKASRQSPQLFDSGFDNGMTCHIALIQTLPNYQQCYNNNNNNKQLENKSYEVYSFLILPSNLGIKY